MQPAFIYTDASFAGGNNTPQEWMTALSANGYGRAVIIDQDSAGALIQCHKWAKSKNVGFVAGITLTLSMPERDSVLWFSRNPKEITDFFELCGLPLPSPAHCYAEFKTLHHAAKQDRLIDDVSERISGKTKASIKKDLNALLKKIPADPPYGTAILVAKNTAGYHKILQLASTKGINKHFNLHNPDAPARPAAVSWRDVESTLSDDLWLIDPLQPQSVIGAVLTYDNTGGHNELITDFARHALLGVTSTEIRNLASCVKDLNRPFIPLPVARFSDPKQWEEYRVKVAVHLKDKDLEGSTGNSSHKISIFDPGFPSPSRSGCLLPLTQWNEKVQSLNDEFPIDWAFWDNLSDTVLPIGQVHLPNYAMDIIEVVRYAAKITQTHCPDFHDPEQAKSWFSEWIKTDCPEGTALQSYTQRRLNDYCLHAIASKGLHSRLDAMPACSDETRKKYLDRFDMEYRVIESMGFSGYFLIVYDVVSHAREIGVPVGDGRGSAAGSLVVYSLEITDVDPIEYDLQFERFLNPERVSMPDIDVDFGDGIGVSRNTVLHYISKKYQQKGTDHPSSSQIANINRYQLKAALSAVRASLGLSQHYDSYLKQVVKLVELSLGIKSPQAVSWEDFLAHDLVRAKVKKEPILARVIKLAHSLSGKRATYGLHAGGVVISPTVITDFSAVECDDKGKYYSQFDKDDVEQAGLIKFDFLGLRTLSIIEEAVKLITQSTGEKIDHRALPKDEKDVMALICQQQLADIFQLESSGMRDLVGRLQPQDIGEIGVLSALFRPGALDSGMVDDFVAVKFGRQPANYEHPALKKVTGDTYGCIVYQEQVMSIVRELAGYSLGEADLLRRAMGKKKIEEMQKQKSVYTYRAQQHWRTHYLEVGKTQSLDFPLDVNLEDCRPIFDHFGVKDAINEHGYLAMWEHVVPAIAAFMDWTEADINQFMQRINDMNYVVRLFKEHYHANFMRSVVFKVQPDFPAQAQAFATRFYFAVSQMVRFNQIFNKVEKFAGYGFNKSHAIAYSIITYKSAFFKKRYPSAFYSAALTFKKLEKLHDTVTEAKASFGINLSTPHINLSEENFFPEGEKQIRYGMGKLLGMGNFVPFIINERNERGHFVSLFDFIQRLTVAGHKPPSSVMEPLCCTGAFDMFIPQSIKQSEVNGRQFMFWLRELIIGSTFLPPEKSGTSLLHQQLEMLTPYEMHIYFTTLAKPAWLKKANCDERIVLIKSMSAKKAKQSVSLFDTGTGLESIERTDMSRPVQAVFEKDVNTIGGFEEEYTRLYKQLWLNKEILAEFWTAILKKDCSSPIIDTLNKERHFSGMYITSNPLRVLKVADLASREPPGTYLNGYPVKIAEIDATFDSRRVSTYGIIRDVQQRTVKREDSPVYGEKLLIFKLEDGANVISCMIFGTRASKQFLNKIVADDVIALVGGEVKANEYGLTISIEAMKRYFPTADEMLQVVPKSSRK